MRWLAATLALFFLASTPAPERPSFLLITIDTLRADRVGGQASLTPELDALARDGVRFTQAMAQVPITLPSHACIMTGAYPTQTGVRDFGAALAPGQETLAEILRENGYRTAAFVSSFALDSRWGLDQGFELYVDDFDLSGYRGVGFNAVERRGDETVETALKWLRENRKEPFFAWVHLFDPHDPYTPPEPYRSQFRGRPYDGEVAFADAQAGRLLAAVKEDGLYDRMLIAVLGDHGEGLGEHGEETHGFFVYDTTLHIPLILKFPDGQFKGRVVKDVVRSIDVAPTVLQTLRLPRGRLMQGQGLIGALRDRPQASPGASYGESYYARYHFGWSSLASYRDQRYKYIRAPRPELYDIQADPAETRNIYPEATALGLQYDNSLDGLTRRFTDSAGADTPPEMDAETVQRLQSLGYVALSAGKQTSGDDRGRADPKDKIGVFAAIRNATILSEKGDFQGSIRLLEKVVVEEPEIYTARYLQGFNYFNTEKYLLAVDQFKAALAAYPDSPEALHSLATSYLRLGLAEAAETGYRRLLEVRPDSVAGRLGLGNVALKMNRPEEARLEFEKALSLSDEVPALLGLGRALAALDRLDEALERFKTALAKAPQSADVHLLLGLTYRKKGEKELAERHLALARRLQANRPSP